MDNLYAEVVRKFVEVTERLNKEQKVTISCDNIAYDEYESDPIKVFIHHAKDEFALRLRFDIVDEDDIKYVRVEVCTGEYNHYDNIIQKRKFITRFRYEFDDLMQDTLMDVMVVTIDAICINRYTEYLNSPRRSKTELAGGDEDINPWMY